jgi:hypothetical protein
MPVIDYAKRFIIFVSSYLGGITALCYVMGFLAETSRWIRLGVPEWGLANKQYLVTGAKFFGFLLPDWVDGCLVFIVRYWWLLLLLISFGGITVFLWKKGKAKQGLLLAGEIVWLMLLFYFLRFSPDSFLGPEEPDAYHLGVDTTDLLFKSYLPPPYQILRENYQLLVALFFLFAAGTVFFLSLQRKLNFSTIWRRIHRGLLVGISLLVLIDFFLLSMNYAHLLIYKKLPVVEVSFTPGLFPNETIPPMLQLRRDKEMLLFYVQYPGESNEQAKGKERLRKEIWAVNQEEIKALRVLENRSVWDSTNPEKLTPLQPEPNQK